MTNIDLLYQAYLASRTVTTDSRNITPGCIFFAFKGERFDGNAFAPQALEQGAALCVISDPQYKVDDRCIVVPDVLATLQELAREHRRHLGIPVIGITGTNGKTTTKELVHAVLAKRYKTSATKGNFNNHLGVPLTLLAIPENTELAIVEMGANHPGEIAFLCGIADPDLGLITNVGRAHLEGFGSFEGVIQTKTELYRHLAVKEGTIFVNADNPILMEQASTLATQQKPYTTQPILGDYGYYGYEGPTCPRAYGLGEKALSVVTYGNDASAMTRGTFVENNPYLHFYFEVGDNVYNVHTHLLGAYNFDNCMAAVAVGMHFGVEPWDIKEAIEEYVPSNQRSEFKETALGNRLYLDCYNANPSSMAAAIESFKAMKGTMAVIGGMHELGAEEQKEHERVVEQLAACHLNRVLLVGPEWYKIENSKFEIENSIFTLFPDTDSVRAWLQEHPVSGATILIKGSNTNRLWTLEELL